MFTGLVEAVGTVLDISMQEEGYSFVRIKSPLGPQLQHNQSVAHQGICLSVSKTSKENTPEEHGLTLLEETKKRTNFADWRRGSKLNLERALPVSGRWEGHIVQGHVDTVADCVKISREGRDRIYTFSLKEASPFLIEKGSVALNGISLTVFGIQENIFSVALIPHSFQHTHFLHMKKGDRVNVEFDMVGKYIVQTLAKRIK
ncbi:MAG: riboflavin synthase [Cytophagales bacterium]|nr:riboflavin synthase [Cytophagales bacterium]